MNSPFLHLTRETSTAAGYPALRFLSAQNKVTLIQGDLTREELHVKFYELLIQVAGRLVLEQRLSYLTLRRDLGLDEAEIADIRTELTFRGIARDEDGHGLVWTGASPVQSSAPLQTVVSSSQAPLSQQTSNSEFRAFPFPDVGHRTSDAGQSAAERRQLTVMFCDLVGSTSLSGRLDPEDLREVVRAYQEAAAGVIQQYDGHIAQYLGDGLLVYFGYPQAHEGDAQRAVHTGLGIVAAMESLNSRLRAEHGVELAVRLGIHTGPVVVGRMGGGGRHEQLALGETPNIAARLEGLAQPNTVVISHATSRLVSDTFALETLGLQTLKGVSEPVEVWKVIDTRIEDHQAESALHNGVPLLVGRDEEIGLLRRRWEQSKEGVGQVVLISGEAGLGKSSLVNLLRAQVIQEGFPRLTFRCSQYHTNSVLHPVITHIQQLLQFEREDNLEVKLEKLERGLQPYKLPVESSVPLFAALLSVPLPAGRYPALNMSPQQQRQQTLDALNAWLFAEAERQPVLVLWEDLHWADPTTLQLLSFVAEQVPTVPLLNVLTFRPEFVPPWPTRSHMTPLVLNRLELPQVEALMTRLAAGKQLPPEVVTHVVTRADGVPLYVEELTKTLLESEILEEQSDHYRLARPLSDVAIPTTLQESLMARLDRLPAVREVAQVGAVLGREFSYELLRALSVIDENRLQEGLAKLVETELLYQRGRLPRAKFMFKHALVQDAAYQSLLRRTRQQYHQRGAQVLETHFPDLAQTEPEVVAHHFTEAGCVAEAVGYWLQAGQRAAQRSAHHEAIAHLRKGLHVLATLPDSSERIQQELLLQVTLGVSLVSIKGYAASEVEQLYTHARELCHQVGETPQLFQVLRGLVLFYLVRGQTQPALELAELLLPQAERQTEIGPQMLGHYLLGMALFQRGVPQDAARHFEQAASLYDRQQHHQLTYLYGIDIGVAARSYLAWPLWLLGYPERALQCGKEALVLAQELGHPFSLVFAQCWLGWLHQCRQETQLADERAAEGASLATKHGFALYAAWSTVTQGWALTQQGQVAAGIARVQQGIGGAAVTGAEALRPYFLTLLAEATGNAGKPEEGLRLLSEAVEVAERTEERFYASEIYRLRGELMLSQSGVRRPASDVTKAQILNPQSQEEAEASFFQAIAIARQQHAKSLELRAVMSLVRLRQLQAVHHAARTTQHESRGALDEAHKMLSSLCGGFTEGFDTKDLQQAKVLLDEWNK